ncbi:MAG: DUF6323 family protein [Oscillospiraceae bacterium]|nr:DUF6323 family protein [Oscillospiraceae bacterium]
MEYELAGYMDNTGLTEAQLTDEILSTNENSRQYGLCISQDQAKMLVKAGKEALKTKDRVEFGSSITPKLIEKFAQSSYVSQVDFAQTIAALIDVFYEVKDQSCDVLSDDDVLDIMFYCFENTSMGSVELLQTRDMEYITRDIRNKAMNVYSDDDMYEQ